VNEHEVFGESRPESLQKSGFRGGIWCGSAMTVGLRIKVGQGFVLEAKRGKPWKYVKCRRGGRESEMLVLFLGRVSFFSLFFLLSCIYCFKIQKTACIASSGNKTYKSFPMTRFTSSWEKSNASNL